MSEFKLFVVGPKSGDPATWSIWNEPSFVMARTPEEAAALCDTGEAAHEVIVKNPTVIWTSVEPNWGNDI